MRFILRASVIVASAFLMCALGQEALPFLEAVPRTSFSCVGRPYGYFADVEANCQVFHICLNNAQWDFLCPNQTLFNQEYFVCDHPINVDCESAESFYALNDNFGKIEIEEDTTDVPVEEA